MNSEYVQVCVRSNDRRVLDSGMMDFQILPAEEGRRFVSDLNARFGVCDMHLEAFARPVTQLQACPTVDQIFEVICQLQGLPVIRVPDYPKPVAEERQVAAASAAA